MYVKLLSPKISSHFSKFSSSSADIFCNPPQNMGRKILKGLSKRSIRYWPLALSMKEKFWKICQNIRQLSSDHAPTCYVRACHYNTLYNALFVRFIRIISGVLKMWLISILPIYSYEKSCLPIFNMNAINCGPNLFFISDYYSV